MRPKKIVFRTFIRQPVEAIYRWHLRSNSILRGFPSWGKWVFVKQDELEGNQHRITYKQKELFGWSTTTFRFRYDSQRHMFISYQEKGKLKMCTVTIELRPHSVDACEMVERVEYRIKYPWFFPKIRKKIQVEVFKAFFTYRQETILKDLEFYQETNVARKQKILISGSNGMVGSSLRVFLQSMGHEVYALTRKRSKAQYDVFFDDRTGEADREKLEGFDIVINLRGQSVLARWTQKKKNEIVQSRVDATKKLSHILVMLKSPPTTFLNASAIGYYGSRGEEMLNEKSEPGKGAFLSQLTTEWEEASKILIRMNIRVVNLRFGLILSMGGGALSNFVLPIRLGLPGILGDGKQFVSWIALDDAISAIAHCMFNQEIAGPVNIVSPTPISNYDLSSAVANYYGKQLWGKVPAGIIRLFTGEMGDELMLSSLRCFPKVLDKTGFRFRYPTVKEALKRLMFPIKVSK